MFGGGNNDVTFDVNIALAQSKLRQLEKEWENVQKGVVGAAESFNTQFGNLSRGLTNLSIAGDKAQQKYIQNLEKMGTLAGKSGQERVNAQFDREIANLKKAGDAYGKLEDNIRRVNAVRKQMLDAESSKGSGSGDTSNLIFRGARDLFEGRTAFGEVQLTKAIGSLSGVSAILGGVTAAFGALAIGSVEAARSVAAYGQEVHDAELKTGLTATQVQRFQFAAKITGQDISVLDRMMRGLTNAIEGTDSKADKARKTMMDMGVDLRSLRDGTTSSFDLFKQLARALEAQPNLWMRNKEAIDLFQRSGIQSLPMLLELNQALKDSGGIKFAGEEQIAQFVQINRDIVRAESEWDQFMLQVKGALAKPFVVTLNFVSSGQVFGTLAALFPSIANLMGGEQKGLLAELVRKVDGYGKLSDDTSLKPTSGPHALMGPSSANFFADEAVRKFQSNQGLEFKLREAEKELNAASFPTVGVSSKEEVGKYQVLQQNVEGLKAQIKSAHELTSYLKELDDQHRKSGDAELTQYDRINAKATEQISKLQELGATKAVLATRSSQINADAAHQIDLLNKKLDEQAARELKSIDIAQSRTSLRFRQQREAPINVRDLGKEGVTAADITGDINARFGREVRNAVQERQSELQSSADLLSVSGLDEAAKKRQTMIDLRRADAELSKTYGEAEIQREQSLYALKTRENDDNRHAKDEIAKIQEKDYASEIKHRADLASKIAELADKHLDPTRGVTTEYGIRKQEADLLYAAEEHRIALHESGNQAEISHARALRDLDEARNKAVEDANLKLFEIQQHQLDEIKAKTESLYHTLFTSPSKFGSQLGSTLRDAALKPFESGLADLTSRTIQPLVGGIGKSIGGLFGGSTNKQVAIDGGGAALVRVVNFGPGGSVGTSVFGGFGGVGGGSTNSSGGSFSGSGGGFGSGFGGFSPAIFGGSSVVGGPGGTSGFAGSVYSGGGYGGSGTGGSGGGAAGLSASGLMGLGVLGGYAGSGKTTGGGIGGILGSLFGGGKGGSGFSLSGLKDSFWNENINLLGGGTQAASSMGALGKIGGVLSSKGAGQIELGVGLPLALAGLTGSRRGTAGGIFEGTLGGALTGAGIGTMFLPGIGTAIGAGIGAIAGFGIGIGEKLAGVESPENEAKRLAKSIYHVSIDNNMAKQIVGAAQQYGGSIATAIRSPEIRNLIMLYSQATGQGNLLSSTVPRQGALQESGGRLSQLSTWTNGTPYVYQSSLPVAGGFNANVFGGAGASTPIISGLQINIGGQGAAQFMNGQIVTPENIQAQTNAAYMGSNNRVGTSALLNSPGLITG